MVARDYWIKLLNQNMLICFKMLLGDLSVEKAGKLILRAKLHD
jgi:hypothetical protein